MTLRQLLAGSLAAALCLLTGCTGTPDNREDPLSGYTVDGLLPFDTRDPLAAATATPTPTPESTAIISVTQNWQNEAGPVSSPDPTTAATRAPYTFTRLEQGSEGEEVLRLQNRLIELGYLTVTADGKFGANTKSAVKLFQKALGLSQTGVATVSLQEKLFMSSAPAYSVSVTPPPADASSGYQALVRGDNNMAVQTLQNRLIQLGYLSGGADGKFGANTENAVKAFQAQMGLSQTGVASASLQTYLFSDTAPRAPSQPQATQKPTAAPTQAQQSSEYKALEPGSTGNDVVRMQNRLKELGYFTGNATGNYYKETTAAVQRFQAQLGLSQTGIASSSLLSRLYSSSAPAYTGNAAPTPTVAGYTTLQRGSKGTEVMNLQKRLISLGYMTTAADGDFGSRTENAVKLFQKTMGYTQDGIATVALQQLIFSASAPVYTAPATQVPTQAPTAPVSGYQRLEPGATGDAVKLLQSRLKQLGFFSGLIGGNYLTKTTDAVRLFQAAIGHTQTGIATPEMQEILFSDDAPDYSSVESDYVSLEKLDSGIQVLNLQQRLIELGWLTGSADGDFGSKTETAVKAFQAKVGLEQSGKATPAMQELLFAATAPYAPQPTQAPTQVPAQATQIPTQAPTQAPAQSGYTSLSYGNSGEAVVALQTRLQALGYFEGLLGGNYLARTETAVKLFQAAMGYTPDGVATPALQEMIFSASAPAYNGSGMIDLQKGSEGVAVKRLQQRLIELGYLTGTADGDFGGGTENAVKAFQQAAGYGQDGVATVALQQLLFSASAPAAATQATSAPPAPTDAPAQPEGPRTLQKGMNGDDVVALQRRLIELGYLTGTADGDFGGGTEQAIRAFQQAAGYSQDGVATPALQDFIFSASAPAYVPSEPEDTGYPTLSYGSTGEDVKAIQRRLMELGYFDGDIGGNYLTKTEASVKLFQAAIGFTQDGVASPELQDILFASNAPAFSTSVRPEQLTVLSRGDTGAPVKSLQQRLIDLGWLTGTADGDFGGGTEEALKAFQYRCGLELDGVASIEVQEILYAVDAPPFVEYKELLPGMEGEEVLNIQTRLVELGYLEETPANQDGIYGAGLQEALKQIQVRWYEATEVDPLLADGLATVELQTFLFSENANLFAILPEIFG